MIDERLDNVKFFIYHLYSVKMVPEDAHVCV
jgi:hypothetical protein